MQVFIELHRDGKRMLVNTMWISGVSEKAGWIDIGDGGDVMFCDESFDEIKEMIKKAELAVSDKNV